MPRCVSEALGYYFVGSPYVICRPVAAWQRCGDIVPGARGGHGARDGHSLPGLTSVINRVLPAPYPQLHHRCRAPVPCCALEKVLPENHVPYKILFHSSVVREKEGLASKRLAFINVPI